MSERQTVRDGDGNRYILLKRSTESSLVRDPASGEYSHRPNDELVRVEGQSPLRTATAAVPEGVVTLLTAVPDERALGLLLELDAEGPLAVRTLLGRYDLCESDLHGFVTELKVAGLLTECDVAGERGYATTERASEALELLRGITRD